MATEFRLPEVSENVPKATVVNVLVAKGDTISKDQPVIEIETDKATLEVPSEVAGLITELRVKQGDEISVGDVVLVVENGAAAGEKPPKGQKKKEEGRMEESRPAIEQPRTGKEKEEPRKVEPEKGGMKEEEAGGREAQARSEPAAAAEKPRREESRSEPLEEKRAEEKEAGEESPVTTVAASPSVRRLAREIGVDISKVRGSGPGGRISEDDVKSHAQQTLQERAAGRGAAPPSESLPDFSKYGEVERRAMSSIRRITAERLSYAWATIPHVHQFDKADITELEALRKRHNERTREGEAKLTMTAIILKVVTNVLRKYPQVNASLDMEHKEVVYKRFHNIGVAVDTDRGLLVPVIRDADRKTIVQLARELDDIARRARAGKLGIDEMKGGTFTITNLGGIGGTNFTPIINPPEVAILGVARAEWLPVMSGGKTETRLLLPLSLGYDHRVVDGADGARFLRDLAGFLTNPLEFLLEM